MWMGWACNHLELGIFQDTAIKMAKHPISSVFTRAGKCQASSSQISRSIRENNIDALIVSIEAGIEVRVVARLPGALGATRPQIADLLGVSTRSFQRLMKSPHGAVSRHVGERSIRILQVRQKAVDIFENEKRALAWLHEPNVAFAQRSPIVHARTELGCRQIENELNRIDHCVFS